MTDPELTKLCAEAMQVENKYPWNPLRDDAQAMTLVKRFELEVMPPICWTAGMGWGVTTQRVTPSVYFGSAHNPDLNRAIVECVAKMQKAKADARQAIP